MLYYACNIMYVILCDAEKCPWVMASVIKVQNHIFLFVFYSLLLSSAKQVFTFHCRLYLTNIEEQVRKCRKVLTMKILCVMIFTT